MATKGFTKIDNLIIFDLGLSLEAIGLYVKLQHLSSIDNFSIKRAYIKSISGYGETAFRRVWKELKDKCILLETKTSNKGRYEYSYILKTNHNIGKAITPTEEKKHKYSDSDGNIPINGQMYIDDILGKQETTTNENAEVVEGTTGFNKCQSTELLKEANNDVNKVTECYQYALGQIDVKNIFSYTKWAIKNYKSFIIKPQDYKKTNFADYQQRLYDYDKLERALVYGEQYELPA